MLTRDNTTDPKLNENEYNSSLTLPTILLADNRNPDTPQIHSLIQESLPDTKVMHGFIEDLPLILKHTEIDLILINEIPPQVSDISELEGLLNITIPTLILSSNLSKIESLLAKKATKFDFILKSMPDSYLVNRIRFTLNSIQDQHLLKDKINALNALNKKKNEFLGVVAHDLRNPISIIRMFADGIEENTAGTLCPDQKLFIERIQKICSYMLTLLGDLLDISVLESGKIELNLNKLDYRAFVVGIIERHRISASAKTIEIKLQLPDSVPVISFDQNKINQVLDNLISNALKFSPNNSIIWLKVEAISNEIVTYISDEGPGIPADEQSHLFEVFKQGSAQPLSGEKGAGLGLSIAKRIIDAHNGRIGLTSEIGLGSVFYFSLPLIANQEHSHP